MGEFYYGSYLHFSKDSLYTKALLGHCKKLGDCAMSKAASMKVQRKPTNSTSPTKESAIGDLCSCGVV